MVGRATSRRAAACLAAAGVLLLGACGAPASSGPGSDAPSATAGDGPTSTAAAPGDIPTTAPGVEDAQAGVDGAPGSADDAAAGSSGSGSGGTGSGGTGSGGTGSGGTGSGGSGSGGGPAEPAVQVAGPTLYDDYPEYWGNLYSPTRVRCATVGNRLAYDVVVAAVTASDPAQLVTGCAPDSGEPAAGACRDGAVLAARDGGCTLGVVLAAGTDPARNHTPRLDWRFSVACPDTTQEPCSSAEVVAAAPSRAAPVLVSWTTTTPLRYCGGTDYADDTGAPGGTGYAPRYGCSAEAAASAEPPDTPGPDADPQPSGQPSASSPGDGTTGPSDGG